MRNKSLADQTEIRNLNNELDKYRDIKSNNEKLNVQISKLKSENEELNVKINKLQSNSNNNNNNNIKNNIEYEELNRKYSDSLNTILELETKLKNSSNSTNYDNYQSTSMKVYI